MQMERSALDAKYKVTYGAVVTYIDIVMKYLVRNKHIILTRIR